MVFTPPQLLNSTPWKHLKIGLFGGTFNPPHEGHVHVCHVALQTGQFDFIWWMVTPQNPLKTARDSASFEQRLRWSRDMIQHPKILITDIEQQLGTYKSIDTICGLKKKFPQTNFTFIAGTDNALHLHKWEEWQRLVREIPFLFIARPPALDLVQKYPARIYKHYNMHWLLKTKLVDKSSTNIRKNQTR